MTAKATANTVQRNPHPFRAFSQAATAATWRKLWATDAIPANGPVSPREDTKPKYPYWNEYTAPAAPTMKMRTTTGNTASTLKGPPKIGGSVRPGSNTMVQILTPTAKQTSPHKIQPSACGMPSCVE